jgi:hypothetical protein
MMIEAAQAVMVAAADPRILNQQTPFAPPSTVAQFNQCLNAPLSATCPGGNGAQLYVAAQPQALSTSAAGWDRVQSALSIIQVPAAPPAAESEASSTVGLTDLATPPAPETAPSGMDGPVDDFRDAMQAVTALQHEVMNFSLASSAVSLSQSGMRTLFQSQG